MFVGKVVGTVWSTKKVEGLSGLKLLVIHPYNLDGDPVPDVVVAADRLGAGIGEDVIVAFGKAAREGLGSQDLPVEAGVVAIIDGFDLSKDVLASLPRAAAPAGRGS